MNDIGFCHSATFKIINPYTEKNIKLFKKCGCTAIEVNCHSVNDINKLEALAPYIQSFKHRSIHLPCDHKYKDDILTNIILKKIKIFYHQIGASLALVHPDLVEDWRVFYHYPSINWAIENMDDRKTGYKNVGDIKDFFNEHPEWKFVLDVGHCNANDKTMKLAIDLTTEFKDIIKEIHLSGYINFHEPLHLTRQIEIIHSCKNLNVPIIIESTFEKSDGFEGVSKEFNYILKNLK